MVTNWSSKTHTLHKIHFLAIFGAFTFKVSEKKRQQGRIKLVRKNSISGVKAEFYANFKSVEKDAKCHLSKLLTKTLMKNSVFPPFITVYQSFWQILFCGFFAAFAMRFKIASKCAVYVTLIRF
jgi:hypothetical protein